MKRNTVLFVLLFAFLPVITFAQKDVSEKRSEVIYSTSSDAQNPNGNDAIQKSDVNQERKNLIIQEIHNARQNGDISRLKQLEQELDNVTGNKSVNVTVPNMNGPQPISIYVNEPVTPADYNYTALNSNANWANATSTDRTGRIWVACTAYNIAGSDTLKIYTSTTAGVSWTLFNKIAFGVTGVHFRNDELDIEGLHDGTAAWIYVTAGLNYSGTSYSFVSRYKGDGTGFFFSYLYSSTAARKHVYPRITSDNSKWTSSAYVYSILTRDSTIASTPVTHHFITMYSLIMNPFAATPTITYRNFSDAWGGYWWQTVNADSCFLYSDIAYSDSSGSDRVFTVSNFYKVGTITNIFGTQTSDYGATVPKPFQITEANVNYIPRLAFQGNGVPNGMLSYTRRFSATDWDPYYRGTTNNGVTWTSGYVESLTNIAVSSDVVAVKGAVNTFRFAYAIQIGATATSNVWVRPFNGAFVAASQVNPVDASANFSPIRAGYRLAADSCFASWSVGSSNACAVSAGCGGAVTGIGNTGIPVSYSLSQNFPNPFNPSTRINYSLPKDGLVKITVFDVLGKEVGTLVNKVQTAGSYILEYNASALTSGIYFYKLESGNFVETKKMMLVK